MSAGGYAITTVIHWFRRDLRLGDNPALRAASEAGNVLPVFILDDCNAGEQRAGAASRWWLHHSLIALDQSLDGRLLILRGDPLQLLPRLARLTDSSGLYWNRCYEPWQIRRDKALKSALQEQGLHVQSENGSLLWEPWTVLKKDDTPYRVFTPFYRKGCLPKGEPPQPRAAPEPTLLNAPKSVTKAADLKNAFCGQGETGIRTLGLLPEIPWDSGLKESWTIGEQAASERLGSFLESGLDGYQQGRDFPGEEKVSRLSPHLHFGEISPRQAWHRAQAAGHAAGLEKDLDSFCSELAWREFSYYLLFHFPQLPHSNFQDKFDRFPWTDDPELRQAWQQGQTGFPLIDAGMRELWETGYLHNRVRMVVASFLIKNLLQHWHHGEAWFRDTLVDFDLASNSASWQWVAGSGADAAPYFRIFNPVTQSEKFDPQGKYIRRFVPELAGLPDRYVHKPWGAPEEVLAEAGVRLGENYPERIIDLKASRERALLAFQSL